jgi:hypothetical protein
MAFDAEASHMKLINDLSKSSRFTGRPHPPVFSLEMLSDIENISGSSASALSICKQSSKGQNELQQVNDYMTKRFQEKPVIPPKINLFSYLDSTNSTGRNRVVQIQGKDGEIVNEPEQIQKRMLELNTSGPVSIVKLIRRNKLIHYMESKAYNSNASKIQQAD